MPGTTSPEQSVELDRPCFQQQVTIIPRRSTMLVLTRRIGEEIVIDGVIRVMITGVQGGKVRLGISAPPEVAIDRKEIHDRRASLNAPIDSELVPVGHDGNELDQGYPWPPIDLGGGD
jgi:carbon storage regulator